MILMTRKKKRKIFSDNRGRNRKKHFMIRGILAVIMLLVCTGCNAKEVIQDSESTLAEIELAEQKTEINTEAAPSETLTNKEQSTERATTKETSEQEPSGSFKVTYQGQEAENAIELRHCDQVYDADNIQIYAKHIYWLMVPETFPSNQYVLYIKTPQEQIQLYPIADFLVDKEQKTLYTKIVGDDGFERVQRFLLTEKDESITDTQKELFNLKQAEKMLCDAFDKAESSFSNITVELTETKSGSAGIICGETGGIEKATGQRYYADWEIALSDNKQRVTPCTLKQYDLDTDKEIFADSSRIFDEIEQGDWSSVKPIEEMDYLWGSSEGEWLRMDVNGDGLPELINGWEETGLGDDTSVQKINITYIFTYRENAAELVYVDVNDGMEFLYIAGNGNLVYEWCVSGGPGMNAQRLCRFDLKWNKEYLDTLVRYNFPEGDGMSPEYYQEYYPDTYGVGGYGIYFIRERKKTQKELENNEDGKYTVREYLTEEQFLNAYEKMTGWDFYKSQTMY